MPPQSDRYLRLFLRLEYGLLEWSLLVLLAINGVGIFARYVMQHAIGELFEIMILGSVAIYWIGIATAQREQAHLGVGFVLSLVPDAIRRVVDQVRTFVMLGFLAVVVYSGVRLTYVQFRNGTVSGVLDLPLWAFSLAIPVGGTLMAIRIAGQALAANRSADEP